MGSISEYRESQSHHFTHGITHNFTNEITNEITNKKSAFNGRSLKTGYCLLRVFP